MSKNQIVLCILFCFALPLLAAKGDAWNENSSDSEPIFNSEEEPIVTVPLHGNSSLGYYFVNLYFGTPAQERSMIIDLHGPETMVICKGCGLNCGSNHLHEPYDPKKSQTDREMVPGERLRNYFCPPGSENHCTFNFTDPDDPKIQKNFRQDFISFENYTLPENQKLRRPQRILEEEKNENYARAFMSFECIVDKKGEVFDSKADGVLGLGRIENELLQAPSIIALLTDRGFKQAFSLCVGSQGGYMTIGGYNTTYHEEKSQYLEVADLEDAFAIHWRGISFNGRKVEIDRWEFSNKAGYGAIFDPSAEILTTKPVIYEKMVATVLDFCAGKVKCGKYEREEGNCWYHDKKMYPDIKDFFATFGTFKFDFGRSENDGVVYEWKPEDYLIKKNEKDDIYCLGIKEMEKDKVRGGTLTTLGATFMRNHDILFDSTNSRIGFVRANCSAEYSLGNEHSAIIANENPVNEKQDFFWVKLGIFGVVLVVVIWFLLNLRKKGPEVKFGGVELQDGQKKNYSELDEQDESDSPDRTGE